MKNFTKIDAKTLAERPIDLIGNGWMLVSAGTREKFNTMTANWGGLGVMWGKPVAFVVIRPQRFTKEFVDAGAHFSLSFLPAKFKPQMARLGKFSGREIDKMRDSGLTPIFDEATGTPFFDEAHTALICRKLYAQPMAEKFFIEHWPIEKWYPQSDFHTFYIAEIESALTA